VIVFNARRVSITSVSFSVRLFSSFLGSLHIAEWKSQSNKSNDQSKKWLIRVKREEKDELIHINLGKRSTQISFELVYR
jgi:hypothetical protein